MNAFVCLCVGVNECDCVYLLAVYRIQEALGAQALAVCYGVRRWRSVCVCVCVSAMEAVEVIAVFAVYNCWAWSLSGARAHAHRHTQTQTHKW